MRDASASVMRQPHQLPAEPALSRHLPYASLELMIPTLETIFRIRSLVEFFVLPLAANMHFLTRRLIGVLIPTAAITKVVVYRLLLFSAASLTFAAAMSREAIRYTAKTKVTTRFRKKLELEIYSFLLGPGNAILKMVFWMGWWGVIWMLVSGPWWYYSTS